MTLGNLTAYPKASLLLPFLPQGKMLQIRGTATVSWDPDSADDGAERQVSVAVEEVVETGGMAELYSWRLVETSNFAPACSALAGAQPAPQRRFVTVTRANDVAEDVALFKLDTNGKGTLPYVPGQHVTLRVPVNEGSEPLTRSWTIVENPTLLLPSYTNSQVNIAVKRDDGGGGASVWMHEALRDGDELELQGVEGAFVMDVLSPDFATTVPRKLLLLSAGIGITPFISMLLALQASAPLRRSDRPSAGATDIVLLHSTRRMSQVPYQQKLEALADGSEEWSGGSFSVRIEWVITGQEGVGRVSAEGIAAAVPDVAAREVMLCGPPSYMEDMFAALGGLGVGPERIRTESFLM